MEKGKARSREQRKTSPAGVNPLAQTESFNSALPAGWSVPVCSTVSCSQMPRPALAPAQLCRQNLPRGLTTLPLAHGTGLDCAGGGRLPCSGCWGPGS